MNKREVLSSLAMIANQLDDSGSYASADALTEVSRRLAQYDDDFGGDYDQEMYEKPDYETHEENELMHDREFEDDHEGIYSDFPSAVEAVRTRQANEENIPYYILRDENSGDDNMTYDVMSEKDWENQGSSLTIYRRIEPGTDEDLTPYYRGLEERETPLGMELDGGVDTSNWDWD